jgi:hypothetical protein
MPICSVLQILRFEFIVGQGGGMASARVETQTSAGIPKFKTYSNSTAQAEYRENRMSFKGNGACATQNDPKAPRHQPPGLRVK